MSRELRFDRPSQQGSGVCMLPAERRAEAMAELDGVIRQMPADRSASRSVASTAAASVLNAVETAGLRGSASVLGLRIENFLLGGFCALLSRLAWQETIPVVCLSSRSFISTFTWEAGSSFRSGFDNSHCREIDLDILPEQAAAFQFLPQGKPEAVQQRFELFLIAREENEELRLAFLCATGRWSEKTLTEWLRSLETLLRAAAENPECVLRQMPLLDKPALDAVYARLNDTAVDFPETLCAHELISEQARRTPDAVAVVFGEKTLTYRELDEQSSLRACELSALGAGPNRPVAICMERSENLPLALLSVLKSGSYYVPLDSHHPSQRLSMILEECKPVAVLSDGEAIQVLDGMAAPIVRMDEDPAPQVVELLKATPNDLAYVIYTSGTTGKPKGVTITQRSLVNLLTSIQKKPGMAPGDRMLAVATISFDIATMDMLLPFVSGATLVVADRHAGGDPFKLGALIDEYDATVLQATPFTWRLLTNSGWAGKPGLKMIAGGEALARDLANELVALGGNLWNCYGPTETAIYSSVIHIQHENGIVPVGAPLSNTTFYVVDEGGNLVPPGVPGELYIGGTGVSQGYLLRPELTAQRFVPDTFGSSGGMLFRTGDLVRLLDGEFEFMGRLDHQVKLRGFRIELAEIESVFRAHPAVDNAAVALREDTPGEPRLVAYVTLQGERPKAGELNRFASGSLPEYMLPSRIVVLDAMPLTGSGKVDRKALPVPETIPSAEDETHAGVAGVPAANDLEGRLLAIFRDVLNNDAIGVTDNFFDYGGYSLLTARLFSRIHRTLGVKLPISLLFDAPTPRALAEIIRSGAELPIVVPIRTKGRAAPLFVIHSYLLYSALPEALDEDRPIFGVRELDNDVHINTLEERAALYAREIKAAYPDGPLCLAGWCAAASLTVEVARQLSDEGRVVAVVALFDAERPGYKPQLSGGGALWRAKAVTSAKFHAGRLRGLRLSAKFSYLKKEAAQRWADRLEVFSTEHRTAFGWLQRNTPLLLPEKMREYAAGLGSEDLQPTRQQIYPGKIVLVRASEVAEVAGTEPALGWDSVALGGVEVEFAPGDHESMFRQPHLQQFGQILHRVLKDAEAVAYS